MVEKETEKRCTSAAFQMNIRRCAFRDAPSGLLIKSLVLFRFQRGLKRKPLALIKKLRKAKREAASGEKLEPVRTHLRDMIIVPEMIGSIIGVYNGKTFNQVRACLKILLPFSRNIILGRQDSMHALYHVGFTILAGMLCGAACSIFDAVLS